jgi:hypothetical protein
LTNLHVGKNYIPEKEMREIMDIAMRMDSMKILCEVPFKDKTLTELDVSGKDLGMEGALVVAEYLDGNRALTKFDVSKNSLCVEGTKVLAAALKGNQVMTELNVAGNDMDLIPGVERGEMSGIVALADVISGMGAISKFTFGDYESVAMETTMTVADFSEKYFGVSGAIMLSAFLPKCT